MWVNRRTIAEMRRRESLDGEPGGVYVALGRVLELGLGPVKRAAGTEAGTATLCSRKGNHRIWQEK